MRRLDWKLVNDLFMWKIFLLREKPHGAALPHPFLESENCNVVTFWIFTSRANAAS